jgi:hypothetical protein
MRKSKQVESVDEKLSALAHPKEAEVQAVRAVIKGVSDEIGEEWKWNAPSFSYDGRYLVTFNLWEKERVHLVFHHPDVVKISSPLLKGDYPTRRIAYFRDAREIEAQRAELERIIRELLAMPGTAQTS